MKIGKRLVSLLKAKKITQAELAAKIGLESQSFISAICTDKKLPSLDTLESICHALNISLSDFFKPLAHEDIEIFSPSTISLIERCKKLSDGQIQLLDRIAANFDYSCADSSDNYAALPLLGGAAAGSPINHGSFPDESIMVPLKYSDPEKYYAITVIGDSMLPKIKDKDHVIVRYDSLPENNDIVLIRSDEISDIGYAVKKFHRNGNSYQFLSLNPDFPPLKIHPKNIISIEKVVFIVHS